LVTGQLAARGAAAITMDVRAKSWLTQLRGIAPLLGMVKHHLATVIDIWCAEAAVAASDPGKRGQGQESGAERGTEENADARRLTATQKKAAAAAAAAERRAEATAAASAQRKRWCDALSAAYDGMRVPLEALLNLSSHEPAQVPVAAAGLDVLLDLCGHEAHPADVRELARNVAANVAHQAGNQHRFYKAELERKTAAVRIAKELVASGSEPLSSAFLAPPAIAVVTQAASPPLDPFPPPPTSREMRDRQTKSRGSSRNSGTRGSTPGSRQPSRRVRKPGVAPQP
jgi:hypothetical protein